MSYKPNFIKRERMDSKIPTIKDAYDRVKNKGLYEDVRVTKGTPDKLRKNEPFVLMFRDFIFFDVKSYECRNGDLYIRNIVDGIVLKRYFRMEGDDQLTVFKNREEFDAFMKKVEEEGYFLGPEKRIARKSRSDDKLPYDLFDEISKNVEAKLRKEKKINDDISRTLADHSAEFILDNYIGLRNSETGEIDAIKSDWDGEVFYRDQLPKLFDKIVYVLESYKDRARFLNKK